MACNNPYFTLVAMYVVVLVHGNDSQAPLLSLFSVQVCGWGVALVARGKGSKLKTAELTFRGIMGC